MSFHRTSIRPCPNCNVSNNYFDTDEVEYGNLYHDGGSVSDHFLSLSALLELSGSVGC
jgi:hypothetical protein